MFATAEPPDELEHLGMVTATVIVGSGIFSDIAGGLRDAVGGRAAAWEARVNDALSDCYSELRRQAADAGGSTVYAVRLNVSTVGGGGSAFMVVGTGTACRSPLAPTYDRSSA